MTKKIYLESLKSALGRSIYHYCHTHKKISAAQVFTVSVQNIHTSCEDFS